MIKYVIVQAGGKGTRLKDLTKNKPKGIVPFNNVPIIFNNFNQCPDVKFIIIGDYKFDVLREYLKSFCEVDYTLIKAEGTGTCAGIDKALSYIPDSSPFAIMWSDLWFENSLDKLLETDITSIGLSNNNFSCRWSFVDSFKEEPSEKDGVAGFFIFDEKSKLENIPSSGEFVRWLSSTDIEFNKLYLNNVKELGDYSTFEKYKTEYRVRPFNSLEIKGNKVYKKAITLQGEKIAADECNWYKFAEENNFKYIPKIYSYSPLTIEKIDGINIFKYTDIHKNIIISNFVDVLKDLHSIDKVEANYEDCFSNYFTKTIDRIKKVENLIPFADRDTIIINGKECLNIFKHIDKFKDIVKEMLCDVEEFVPIHGDCTFSNSLVNEDSLRVTLIDPRGYFGESKIYGDEYYDWAKLYYSLVGNYDNFNRKLFTLDINDDNIELQIESSGFESLEEYFVELLPNYIELDKIKLLHAIIWISLTTYAWEDYDSILGAFYKGTLLLDEFLRR